MPMNLNRQKKQKFEELRSLWFKHLFPLNGFTPSDIFEPLKLPDQDSLKATKMYASRYEMLENLPSGGIVAEVGVQEGLFSLEILNRCRPLQLHLIDIDISPTSNNEELKKSDKVQFYEADSSKALSSFPDNFFDWIYIDGDHSYEGVKRDAHVSMQKVKPGGYLVFNDFTIWSPVEMIDYGIPYVVCELIRNFNYKMTHFALHPLGYHDVAIQKSVGN